MMGFEHKVLHLSHAHPGSVTFQIGVDFMGHGSWKTYAAVDVPANSYVPHVFPSGFSAHWVRVVSNTACVATAQLHYT
jgi:hypothetical protein